MTTVDPRPNEHPVHQHRQHDLKPSACAALPSSPPSSPSAAADHAVNRGDCDGQDKGDRDGPARAHSAAVNTDTPTVAVPAISVPAPCAPASSVTESRGDGRGGGDHISPVVPSNPHQSSNARNTAQNASAPTAPSAIGCTKPAHARSVSANAPHGLAHVTSLADSSAEVLPTPPGSAMPSPPILPRGATRLSGQQGVNQDGDNDCVRQEQSGGVDQAVGAEREDEVDCGHDGAKGQSGAALGQASAAEAEHVPVQLDQVPELKSWSSPCADRLDQVVGPFKQGRKLNRAVSWHETVKTPGRAPSPPAPAAVAASSASALADQDPAPTAPPMYLELDLESTPLPRARPLGPPAQPAASAPAPAAAPLQPASKRKRSRSPSPSHPRHAAAAASSSQPPASARPAPLAASSRSLMGAPRRVHTLPAPPPSASTLTVSPTKALEWLQWAECKENINPEDWLRQYQAKKKGDVRPPYVDMENKGKGQAGCGGAAGGYGGGGYGGAGGAAASGGHERRSRNSAPSSSSTSSTSSNTTLSILASRSSNTRADTAAGKPDQPPTKRQRTSYATSAAAPLASSASTLVSLCLASSPMRPTSPPAASCRGGVSANASWLARRPANASASVAAAAEGMHSSPVAAALMKRMRNMSRSSAIR